jgi:HPt (histidine-containing phosphotransfer) domain-containing protein
MVDGSEPPVTLDLERLDRIRKLLGRRPRSFDELLGLFISEAHERVRQVGEALGKGDPAGAATLAHGLRGSSSAFGAVRLAGLCREFEQVEQARGLAGVREAFPAIEAELAAVSCELKSTLG